MRRKNAHKPVMWSSETFCLFVIFLLLALCYGSTQDCGQVTVQPGGMANLIFGFNQDISALRYNFEIQRYDFNNKFREKVLDCFWTENKVPECHFPKRYSIDVNVTCQLHINIKASKIDAGIYECSIVVSDDYKMEVCKLTVDVHDATQLPSEDLTSNASQSISVTLNSSSEDKSRNVGREQSYEHMIPVILVVIVFLAILVTSLLYLKKRHSEKFHQCKCFHTEKRKETDTKDTMDTMEKEDNTDINLQERDSIIIETKPLSEEHHLFICENNRAETSASAATHMIVDERMDLGENVHLRNKTCA